ncbi:glycogen/starch synthase, ADP-glucose type [Pseudoflavonifractor capillosus ATCC 29799]|uniref:Glycogen synthase n=2 Tax=Pseudoflavonifractor capillosus TaxID=106588 RepID=A6P0U1_9FIRM|nr:glycogen/starch synthase, ADP-glucose type [Pseudoflavonifractor capillosus ATCC 29799]
MLYFYQHQIQLYCAVSAEEESGENSIVTHRKGRFIMAREKADSMKKKAAEEKAAVLAEEKAAPVAADAAPEQAPAPTPTPEKAETPAKKPSARGKAASAGKKAPAEKKAPSPGRKKASAKKAAAPAEEKPAAAEKPAPVEEKPAPVEEVSAPVNEIANLPRRSIAFIGSECHPFVKTGGLGDVMYALPRELARLNCDVRVILPRYACIPQEYQDKMIYRGEFYMDLGNTGRSYYVGIMEYIWDGVVYDFIDNQEFFTAGRPYTNLVDDIPKYCFFSKAALAALNYMNWIPDIVHCHDWQTGLVPVYLRTLFKDSPVGRARSILTIHNLRFQGIYNIPTIKYWSGLPDEAFGMGALQQNWVDANMLKGGLAYADRITTVSGTYAWEIQTREYGEGLEDHLRYHSGKLRGIVNGIDYGMWNPETDPSLPVHYNITSVLKGKLENKLALQRELGLEEDGSKFVIGLISRLTNQKGLDLVNAIMGQVLDGNTQVVVLGTGDKQYEDSFRYYEYAHKGTFSACIQYDEARAHRIYAGADALLVPSRFEPCGLTQLNAMHYGTLPIVRETGGLKDTVEPHNDFTGDGNGFTFDRYDAGLLLDAINRAKTLYFNNRYHWDEVVQRDMAKDVSWTRSARQYKDLYLELTQW